MASFKNTKGGTDSNSYASTDEADDYFEFEYGAEEWTDISNDDKEKLLVTATRMIDRFTYLYDKAADTQALNFPCDPEGALDADGNLVSDGFDEAKEACILQAFFLYQNNDGINEAKVGALTGVRSESLGKTSREVTGFQPLQKYAPGFLGLLKKHIDLDMRVLRG